MKKTLNLALVLMATAVSLTLTSCGGGGGGGGGGDTTPNGGGGVTEGSGGGSSAQGYAPANIAGYDLVCQVGSSYASWRFRSGGSVTFDADYTIPGITTLDSEGTYSYSASVNSAVITYSTVRSGAGVTIQGKLEINFSSEYEARGTLTETVQDSKGQAITNVYDVHGYLTSY